MAQFRRPASLSIAQQEQIEGGVDPALRDQLAYDSAAALLAQTRAGIDEATVERVLRVVNEEGLDDIAELWSAAPPVSLPGMLWRMYVLHTWLHRDTDDVKRRYELGSRTAPGLRYLAGFRNPPNLEDMRATMDEIMRGVFTGDLGVALLRASAVAMLVSYGTAHEADSSQAQIREGRGAELTEQADRLLRLGEDLEGCSQAATAGSLF